MREVIADGITNYNTRFLETTPEATDAFPDLLLNGPNNAQQQLQARFGGGPRGTPSARRRSRPVGYA
jgi:hypothetical protein